MGTKAFLFRVSLGLSHTWVIQNCPPKFRIPKSAQPPSQLICHLSTPDGSSCQPFLVTAAAIKRRGIGLPSLRWVHRWGANELVWVELSWELLGWGRTQYLWAAGSSARVWENPCEGRGSSGCGCPLGRYGGKQKKDAPAGTLAVEGSGF